MYKKYKEERKKKRRKKVTNFNKDNLKISRKNI